MCTADIGMSGNDVNGLVAHVLGMGGSKTYAHIWRGLGYHSEKSREINSHTVRSGIAVTIDILSQKSGLLKASSPKIGKLGKYALRLARTLTTASIRDNTIGAENYYIRALY